MKKNKNMQKYKQCWGCRVEFMSCDEFEIYQSSGLARYGVASLECTAIFCKLLVKEQEWAGYPAIHRLFVDAYGACHSPYFDIQQELNIQPRFIRASRQSVVIHLIALYLAFEKAIPLFKISNYMRKILDSGILLEEFQLSAPESFGSISILDVDRAQSFVEYEKLVKQWALSVWQSWSEHHAIIAKICTQDVYF